MPPKIEKDQHLVVANLASSENEGGVQPPPLQVSGPETEMPQSSGAITPSEPPVAPVDETLESRSFWKAGNYAVGPTCRPSAFEGSLEHARVHPKFLHSNATSHKWAFGAIAELMDNAVDEDDVIVPMFEDIGSHGTKVIIFNLWLNDEGIYELAFDDDDEAYASMLYLRPFKNFQIILRGKPVQQFNIADELRYRNVITYKPQLAPGSKEPFWKVTPDGSVKGNGVVGDCQQDLGDEQPVHEFPDEVTSEDDLGSITAEQLCEENIKLFQRCDEYMQKEAELRQTIEELERQLEEMRSKCAQLSSHIEAKRKLKVI
ncbi:MORC family CW-type zinc finger protein 4-like protein [Corchorus olitorius]|uniref:MORC family CW-type zinc finger protein 4-like protein n=1 Tax=Corchorus olitorius TaxID=93759 RepID=A0A1R3IPL3_9ROSI|nr:MORC family CW-type zinc finger protein 4-like protein [Corchorus olitorius]